MVDFTKLLNDYNNSLNFRADDDYDNTTSDTTSFFDRPLAIEDYPVPPAPAFDLTEEQRQAVEDVITWRMDPYAPRFMKLTGAAGVGKTTIVGEIRKHLFGTRTAWTGMTGKAALRLRQLIGAKTKTAHSAIYHPPREVDNPLEAKVDLEFDSVRSDGSEGMLLTIDESSMIGPKFRADLERSSYSKCLLIGDPFQLSPVLTKAEEKDIGGEDYSVFFDVEGPHLTKVMRNAGAVLAAATVVREQQRIPMESGEFGGSRYDYVDHGSPDSVIMNATEAWLDDRQDHVLVTWRNETRMSANTIIRRRLGYPQDSPAVDETMVIRKNYHKKQLMNGDMVRIVEIAEEGPTLAGIPTQWFWVHDDISGKTSKILSPAKDFSGTLPYVGLDAWKRALRAENVEEVIPLTFAYCLTCHLAQGSQYRRVTTMIPGDFRSSHFQKMTRLPDRSSMAMCWRWAYTAISRAVSRASLLISR